MVNKAIGIDLGGTKIKAGVVDDLGQILLITETPTPQLGATILEKILELCRELTAQIPVQAIGIGTPGKVLFPEGTILGCTPNLADWQGRNLREALSGHLSSPIVVDNDANVACYAEWKVGSGKDLKDLVVLTLGTGLGSGQILKGELSRGHHGLGIGFGHMILEANGRFCNCGQRGCLETYVSGKGLVKNYLLMGGATKVAGPEIFAKADQGDRIASAAVDLFVEMLSVGIVNIFNTLAPERILLGGGISAQGEKRLLEPLRQKVKGIMGMPFGVPEAIQLAKLGPDAGMIGAGLLALDETTMRN
jgi:glucokinase